MNAKLVVVIGKTTKREVSLRLPTVLGRSREADVTVAHPLISRRHCEISEANGLLMLRDLGSLNGTMIEGRRVESAPLLPSAEFTIGPLTFRVFYEYDGDLESLPPTQFIDDNQDMTDVGLGDATEGGVPDEPTFEADEGVPAEQFEESDSGELAVPDFMALADADPEVAVPPGLAPSGASASRPGAGPKRPSAAHDQLATEPLSDVPVEPYEDDSSLQSGSHRQDSPWSNEPLIASEPETAAQQPAPDEVPTRSEAPPQAQPDKAPTQSKPPPASAPKQPGYGDEMDPEFGSFLEGLE
jgi:pSer/pThr/pTyr-binding forkhead associated (FHA) protein